MKSSCFPLFNLRTTLLLFGAGGLFFAGAWFSYQVVDLNALFPGIYVVKFISEKGIAARKVVKGN